jgi:hypothetical protein
VFAVGLGQQTATERTEGSQSNCDGTKPLAVKVRSGSIKIGFDLGRGEGEVFVTLPDNEGTFLISPKFPRHDLLLTIGVVEVGVA